MRNADLLAASDLPRAIESARLLAGSREFETWEGLRETPMPVPAWPTLRLPLIAWEIGMVVGWGFDAWRGRHAGWMLERAKVAATWCEGRLAESGASSMAIVTHGVFRAYLLRALVASGWTAEPRIGGYDHWSIWGIARDRARG